jgi:hypothetical protein
MLVQRCTLEQHRLVIPVSITKPVLQSGSFLSDFSLQRYRALVDTGAQRTVLSHSVITEQKLMRTGHMQFASLHGPQTHTRYLASVGFWANRINTNEESQRFQDSELALFSIAEPFEVVDMQDNVNFDIILGFDILKDFSFSFDSSRKIFEIQVR